MRNTINQYFHQLAHKRFQMDELELYIVRKMGHQYEEVGGYNRLVQLVNELVEKQVIKPIKASKLNSMYPPLYNRYQLIQVPTKDLREFGESFYQYHPKIELSYYIRHPERFEVDRPCIEAIDRYLKSNPTSDKITANERSFELFLNEKFLLGPEGPSLLSRIGVDLEEDLNCFKTYEPFVYVRAENLSTPINVLVIENRDTYISVQTLFQEGKQYFCGIPFGYIIYGEGKKILKSIEFLSTLVAVSPDQVHLYYFGDLDPTGIWIWRLLADRVPYPCDPMTKMYEALVNKFTPSMLPMREGQAPQHKATEMFLNYFSTNMQQQMVYLLQSKRYIPQEGLNLADMRRLTRETVPS